MPVMSSSLMITPCAFLHSVPMATPLRGSLFQGAQIRSIPFSSSSSVASSAFSASSVSYQLQGGTRISAFVPPTSQARRAFCPGMRGLGLKLSWGPDKDESKNEQNETDMQEGRQGFLEQVTMRGNQRGMSPTARKNKDEDENADTDAQWEILKNRLEGMEIAKYEDDSEGEGLEFNVENDTDEDDYDYDDEEEDLDYDDDDDYSEEEDQGKNKKAQPAVVPMAMSQGTKSQKGFGKVDDGKQETQAKTKRRQINLLLSDLKYSSLDTCELMINVGKVKINGVVTKNVTELVDPTKDEVTINDEKIDLMTGFLDIDYSKVQDVRGRKEYGGGRMEEIASFIGNKYIPRVDGGFLKNKTRVFKNKKKKN